MKPKKNPQFDIRKKSILFFQIGLIIVLFISWQTVEITTSKEIPPTTYSSDLNYLEPEEVPITKVVVEKPTPIQKTPEIPEVIDQIEKKDDHIEDFVPFPEASNSENPVVEIDSIIEVIDSEPINLPFDKIEEVPIFPGCENLTSNKERKICMNQKVKEFVNKKFNRNLANKLGLETGIKRIYVSFKINELGNIVGVQASGPHELLEEEAARVVESLPTMKPGIQGDKPVGVLYNLPIVIDVK